MNPDFLIDLTTTRTCLADAIEPEPRHMSKATGKERVAAGSLIGKRMTSVGLPATASPSARLFAGYNPHWVAAA